MLLTSSEKHTLVNGGTVTLEEVSGPFQAPIESVEAVASDLREFAKRHNIQVKAAKADPGKGYWETHFDFLTGYSPCRGIVVRLFQDIALRLRHIPAKECPSGPCGIRWQLCLIKRDVPMPKPPEAFAKDVD